MYIFYGKTGTALTEGITLKNGNQTLSNYSSSRYDIECTIYIKDYTILSNLSDGSLCKISDGIVDNVSDFEDIVDIFYNNNIDSSTSNDIGINTKVILLKGKLDSTDSNYDKIKDSGIRIEIKPTGATILNEELFLRRYDNRWWIYHKDNLSNSITNPIIIENGLQELTPYVYNTDNPTFEGYLFMEDKTVLETLSANNDNTYYKLTGGIVAELSKAKSITQHLLDLNGL